MEASDNNKLKSYGDLGYIPQYRKVVDEENAHKLMHAQYEFIKESRKSSKQLFWIAIATLVTALLTLLLDILDWHI